jgi:hypothetical protein
MINPESVLVALIVAACAVFSIWRLLSARTRLRLLDGIAAVIPACAQWGVFARLRGKVLARLVGGSCGACSQAAKPLSAGAQSANQNSGAPRR